MRWRLFAYFRGIAGRRRAEREAEEELAFHLAQAIDAHIAQGVSPADARREALADLGGLVQTREAVRDVRRLGIGWVSRDVRDAIRGLARRPVASAVAILSLALAIGAVTAVLGIVDALYARDLPVDRPDQLVVFWRTSQDHPEERQPLSPTQFEELQREAADVADVFAWDDRRIRRVVVDGVQYAGTVNEVSGNFFAAIGVKPLLGRVLDSRDVARIDDGTSARVAVLDYRTWQNRFAGDPEVLGRTIVVDGTPLTIVGVTPEDFIGLDPANAPDATVPFGFDVDRIPGHATPGEPFTRYVGARLEGDARLEDAAASLRGLWPSVVERTVPADAAAAQRTRLRATRLHIESLRTGTLGPGMTIRTMFVRPLTQLGALGGLVLFVAAINLASLILVRTVSRRPELTLRAALGASRGVLVRSLIVESVLVSVAGAALGLAMAVWMGRPLFDALLGGSGTLLGKPLAVDPRLDLRVAGVTVAIAIAVGIVCALLASWRAISRDPAGTLQSQARVVGHRRAIPQRVLVSTQVALALVLVTAATLVGRSLHALSTRDPGFQVDRILQFDAFDQAPSAHTRPNSDYYRSLAVALTSLPGVESASYVGLRPFVGENWMRVVGSGSTRPIDAIVNQIGPDFVRTMGMRLLAGREFTWSDDEHAPPVAIVSESFARSAFGGAALGRTIDVPDLPFGKSLRIVGVVNNASLGNLHSREPRAVYLAAMQAPSGLVVEVRTAGEPMSRMPSVERAVASLGRQFAVGARPLASWKDYALRNERLVAALATFFAGLTLLLAAAGLYAQLAYAVTARQSEIGVRMAVGAGKRDILFMILREAGWVVLAGMLVGVPAAILAARVASNLLFGLTPYDPLTLGLSALALTAIAFVAAVVPARRASRVDPVVALRVG
jgi:predicted permease